MPVKITPEILQALRNSYAPSVIPPCRICGGALSIGSIGGGEPTRWCCSGQEDDPDRPGYLRWKPDRKGVDKHFSESVYIDRRQGGDERVIDLVDAFEELQAEMKRCVEALEASHKALLCYVHDAGYGIDGLIEKALPRAERALADAKEGMPNYVSVYERKREAERDI